MNWGWGFESLPRNSHQLHSKNTQMKITKAKLEKGTFLAVAFMDGDAETIRRYPHTEAPPPDY
jgi:hypothetical protein